MSIRYEKGITLVALVVTIIVLLILAGIGYNYGRDTIKKAQLEELRTNMLLIEAKAKEYVEEANFKMGISPDDAKKTEVRKEVYEGEAKLQPASGVSAPSGIPVNECYLVTQDTMNLWGLDDLKLEEGENYLIKFNDDSATVEEVYNTVGYDGKYSLTDIDNLEV